MEELERNDSALDSVNREIKSEPLESEEMQNAQGDCANASQRRNHVCADNEARLNQWIKIYENHQLHLPRANFNKLSKKERQKLYNYSLRRKKKAVKRKSNKMLSGHYILCAKYKLQILEIIRNNHFAPLSGPQLFRLSTLTISVNSN